MSEVVTRATNRTGFVGWIEDRIGTDARRDTLNALISHKGVLILFAHGDRDAIYTPDGVAITKADIEKLNLTKNRPTVVLLSCEGGSPGPSPASASFAKTLKAAGADAVWSYDTKLDAADAARTANHLMELLRSGTPLLEALRTLKRTEAEKGPKIRLKVENHGAGAHTDKFLAQSVHNGHGSDATYGGKT